VSARRAAHAGRSWRAAGEQLGSTRRDSCDALTHSCTASWRQRDQGSLVMLGPSGRESLAAGALALRWPCRSDAVAVAARDEAMPTLGPCCQPLPGARAAPLANAAGQLPPSLQGQACYIRCLHPLRACTSTAAGHGLARAAPTGCSHKRRLLQQHLGHCHAAVALSLAGGAPPSISSRYLMYPFQSAFRSV
jgi:hypothetical protein